MLKFVIECTRTQNERFIMGAKYPVLDTGEVIDEYGHKGTQHDVNTFNEWYRDCSWVDYAFKLLAVYDNNLHITEFDVKTLLSKKYGVKLEKIIIERD